MKNKFDIYSPFVAILFSIVTSVYAQDLKITSNPSESGIYIKSETDLEPRSIGKTPFKQDLETFLNTYIKKSSFVLIIKKDGFEPYRVLFTKNKNVEIDLAVNLQVNRDIATIKKHDLLMSQLFKVQKLIRSKNFDGAIARLTELEENYKHFSIIPELKATTYYLNKEIEKSLSKYREAFSLNPGNIDAYKMKVYLEKKLGVSVK